MSSLPSPPCIVSIVPIPFTTSRLHIDLRVPCPGLRHTCCRTSHRRTTLAVKIHHQSILLAALAPQQETSWLGVNPHIEDDTQIIAVTHTTANVPDTGIVEGCGAQGCQ